MKFRLDESRLYPERTNFWRMVPMLRVVCCMAAGICLGWYGGWAPRTWLVLALVAAALATIALLASRLGHWGERGRLAVWRLTLALGAASLLCVMAWQAGDERKAVTIDWPRERRTYAAEVVAVVRERADTLTADVRLLGDQGGAGRIVRLRLLGYSRASHGDSALWCWETSPAGRQHWRLRRDLKPEAEQFPATALRVGDRLIWTGEVLNPEWPEGYGVQPDTVQVSASGSQRKADFDYATFLRIHGISGRAYVDDDGWDVLPEGGKKSLRVRLLRLRDGLTQRLRTDFSAPTAEALSAVALGDRRGLRAEVRADFARVGAAHVLALSGLHLGLLFGLWLAGVRWLLPSVRWRWVGEWMSVPVIWAFVLLAGSPLSLIRSASMLTLVLLLGMRRAGVAPLAILSLATALILAISPMSLLDVGFQLSVLAVAGMELGRFFFMKKNIYDERPAIFHFLESSVGTTLFATLGTLPLVAFHFGRVPLLALWINLPAVWILQQVLILVLVYFLLPLLSPAGSLSAAPESLSLWNLALLRVHDGLVYALSALVSALQSLAAWGASLPAASITWRPSLFGTVVSYLVLWQLLRLYLHRTPRRLFTLAALLLALGVGEFVTG